MPILESDQLRQRVVRALDEIRDCTDAEAQERQDVAAKHQWRQTIAETAAELLGVDR